MDARTVFRLDNDVLAFRFTATVTDRGGAAPRERLGSPDLLRLWLETAGLPVPTPSESDLDSAIELREAIYRAGAAVARGEAPKPSDAAALNKCTTAGQASLLLEAGSAVWRLGVTPFSDALGVLATDAIRNLGDMEQSRVRLCEGPDCAGLFVDRSRAQNRRWCSMNTCGNRVKKSRMAPS